MADADDSFNSECFPSIYFVSLNRSAPIAIQKASMHMLRDIASLITDNTCVLNVKATKNVRKEPGSKEAEAVHYMPQVEKLRFLS